MNPLDFLLGRKPESVRHPDDELRHKRAMKVAREALATAETMTRERSRALAEIRDIEAAIRGRR